MRSAVNDVIFLDEHGHWLVTGTGRGEPPTDPAIHVWDTQSGPGSIAIALQAAFRNYLRAGFAARGGIEHVGIRIGRPRLFYYGRLDGDAEDLP